MLEPEVQLELQCVPQGGVAVALHLCDDAGTPIRVYSSPMHAKRLAGSSDASDGGLSTQGCDAPSSATPDASCAPQAAAESNARRDGTAAAATASAATAKEATAAPEPTAFEQQLQQVTAEAEDAAAALPAAGDAAAALPAAPDSDGSSPSSSAASLNAVMGMLQQLLASSSAAVRQAQDVAAAPLPTPPPQPAEQEAAAASLPDSPRPAAAAMGAALPGGVEKLLALELEVVQLQQSLQIAQLEFETRTVQLHSLKQRADDAEQRAQAAEKRAAGLAQQVHALQRQAGEAAARHALEASQQAAQVSAATASQQAAEAEAARLRQQFTVAQQVAEEEASRMRRQLATAQQGLEREQAEQRRAAAAWQQQHSELREQVASLRHENQQLRTHVSAACGALKTLGLPAHQVFSRAALALAGHTNGMQSPPRSPPSSSQGHNGGGQRERAVAHAAERRQAIGALPAAAPAPPPPPPPPPMPLHLRCQQQQQQQQSLGQRAPPPQVPRLQLSSISLEQLRQAASQQHEAAEAATGVGTLSALQGLPPLPSSGQRYSHLRVSVGDSPCAPAREASPAGSVQHSTELSQLPLTARRMGVSPAQQELLASARQWQLTARSAVAGEEEEERMPAHRPHQQQQGQPARHAAAAAAGHATARHGYGAGPARGVRPPLRAVQTARQHHTPRKEQKELLRWTYGQDPAFLEIKKAYHAVVSSEADSNARWARSVFSSSSAVETDPRRVEPVVQGLLQLFRDSGVPIPLAKSGPCQYRLGSAKLAVRLVNGRLMARAGAGQTVDVLDWLSKQPVHS